MKTLLGNDFGEFLAGGWKEMLGKDHSRCKQEFDWDTNERICENHEVKICAYCFKELHDEGIYCEKHDNQ